MHCWVNDTKIWICWYSKTTGYRTYTDWRLCLSFVFRIYEANFSTMTAIACGDILVVEGTPHARTIIDVHEGQYMYNLVEVCPPNSALSSDKIIVVKCQVAPKKSKRSAPVNWQMRFFHKLSNVVKLQVWLANLSL